MRPVGSQKQVTRILHPLGSRKNSRVVVGKVEKCGFKRPLLPPAPFSQVEETQVPELRIALVEVPEHIDKQYFPDRLPVECLAYVW